MKNWEFSFVLYIKYLLCSYVLSDSLSCLSTENGIDYYGSLNVTKSNKTCIPWKYGATQYTAEQLKINDLEDNSCRNPNHSSTLWCHVSSTVTESCDIKICPTNPDAKYCIPIPRQNFHECPSLFVKLNILIEKEIIFCCMRNQDDLIKLPIKDNCLIMVIANSHVLPNILLCPSGYQSQNIGDLFVNDTTIYQCCRISEPDPSLVTFITDFVIHHNSNLSYPIFASVTNGSCRPSPEFETEIIEYVGSNSSVNDIRRIFSSMKLCFHFLRLSASGFMSESQLGFFSSKNCPLNFTFSDEAPWNATENAEKIKVCWPNDKDHIYPTGQYCLLIKKDSLHLKCPKAFVLYKFHSSSNKEILRLCCKFNASEATILWSPCIRDNMSIIFVKIIQTEECPFMMSNTSMTTSALQVAVRGLPTEILSADSLAEITGLTAKISLCNYEPMQDEFAYKKIGNDCPYGMMNSTLKFRSVLHGEGDQENDLFTIEYCVGRSILRLNSFPKGTYCIYKIGQMCPPGFQSKSITNTKYELESTGLVPDYKENAFCCRYDGNNNQSLTLDSFPYLGLKEKVSFGLLTDSERDACPIMKDMNDHHSLNPDGYFCAYRTREDNYKYYNKIIFPHLSVKPTKKYPIRKSWSSFTQFPYISSVIIKYPHSQFCIVSSEKCASMKNIDFAILYPIAKKFLCCSLIKFDRKYNYVPLNTTKQHRFVGFVSIHGKCPETDGHVYSFQNVVVDIFEIERKDIDKQFTFDLLNLGITLDSKSKPNFVRIKFQFCIYEMLNQTLSRDQIIFRNSNGFIKPIQMECPKGFIAQQNTLTLNYQKEFNPVASHFIKEDSITNTTYATFCFPTNTHDDYTKLLTAPELCTFNYNSCSNGTYDENIQLTINQNYSESLTPFVLCCNNNSNVILDNITSISSPFSLPLKPRHKKCPLVKNFHHQKWKLDLFPLQGIRFLVFCLYYNISSPIPWPSGNYLTVPHKDSCPSYFSVLKYKASSMCVRNQSDTVNTEFPKGQYCVLSFTSIQCPLSGLWHYQSETIEIGDHTYILCCSKTNDLVLNIDNSPSTFAFLSMERCPVVPGTRLIVTPFSLSKKVISCIYVKRCSDSQPDKCYGVQNSVKITQNSIFATQMTVIIVLLVLLLVLIGLLFVFVLYPKFKQLHRRESKANHFRLEAIYNTCDTASEKDYTELDEKTPSADYSTLS